MKKTLLIIVLSLAGGVVLGRAWKAPVVPAPAAATVPATDTDPAAQKIAADFRKLHDEQRARIDALNKDTAEKQAKIRELEREGYR